MTIALDSDVSVVALRRTACCGCGGELPRRGNLGLILLPKRAGWRRPTYTDEGLPGSGGRAIAVLCAYCLHEGIPPKTAVEIRDDGQVVHHAITVLVDVPDMLEELEP